MYALRSVLGTSFVYNFANRSVVNYDFQYVMHILMIFCCRHVHTRYGTAYFNRGVKTKCGMQTKYCAAKNVKYGVTRRYAFIMQNSRA